MFEAVYSVLMSSRGVLFEVKIKKKKKGRRGKKPRSVRVPAKKRVEVNFIFLLVYELLLV